MSSMLRSECAPEMLRTGFVVDRVTKSYLEEFRSEQSLSSEPADDCFEHFANYCVISDAYDDEFDVHSISVGGGNDLGLDGIGILVNGALVSSVEEVDDLLDISGSLDVTFIFVQAKSGGNFEGGAIGVFFDGIEEFFSENPTLPINESVTAAREIMQRVYDNSTKFRRSKPQCRLSYITTGLWTDDSYLQTKIDKRLDKLKETGLFSDVAFSPMGADELHASYQRSKNSITAEFVFSNKVLMPDILGVDEAYLGVIPAPEFLKLIADDNGNIRKSLFYDNIRDFQDYNAVNKEIRTTVRDAGVRGRFCVLNNGVTMVVRQLRTTGNKFAIADYQIVNGCQTSHVLFDEQANLTDAVLVPLKVIATDDDEIISSIITATNRQTEVTTEDLYALGAFQKKLEAFLSAYPDKKRLYYERRSKQYNAISGIEKVRIITKPQQIRTFAAMFLDDPHRASRYYADLQAQVGDKIFNEGHKLEPYYSAAYASYKLEFFFRNGTLPVYYKPARYHQLMALRYVIGGPDMPALTANKVQGYCNRICDVLWDDTLAAKAFAETIDVIDQALAGSVLTRDIVKTQLFTDSVLKIMGAPVRGSSTTPKS